MREQNIKEIKKVLEGMVEEGTEVSVGYIRKNNGLEFCGVNLHKKGVLLTPTIYIDEKLEDIDYGITTTKEVAKWVIEMTEEHRDGGFGDIRIVMNKDYILANVQYQLLHTRKNEALLSKITHKEFENLSAIYRVNVVNKCGEKASFKVNNKMMREYGISFEELDEAATKNTENEGFVVQSMAEVMKEMFGVSDEEIPNDGPAMYVMRNKSGIFGATIMLYSKYFKEIAEKVDDDLIIMPSSIHEVLAVPATELDECSAMEMVREVNNTQLTPDEILSYSVYKYSRETGLLEVA